MNKRMLRALALLLCLLMAVCAAACGQTPAPAPDAAPAASPETEAVDAAKPDSNTVAVQIGDDLVITYGEIENGYNYYVQMMSYYGMPAPSSDADIETMQDQAVAALVNGKKLVYYAKEAGLDALTDEETATLQTMVDEEIAGYMDIFREQATAEGAADVEARATELFEADLIAAGMDMTAEEYKAFAFTQYAEEQVVIKLQESIMDTVTVSDDEVQAYYDALLAEQTEQFAADAGAYLSVQENFEMNGGDPAIVVPEGYIRVKVLMVEPQGEIDAAYAEKTARMGEIEAAYGKLMLTDKPDMATKKALEDEYAVLVTETDALYEAYMANAANKVAEAEEKLQSGESFDAVLAAYGEDTVYQKSPLIAEKGRLMQLEGEDGWDTAIREAALALPDGAYSEAICIDDVYYIVYRVGSEPACVRALPDVVDAVKAAVLDEAQGKAWMEKRDAWDADNSIVTYFEDVYRSIGKQG